MKDISATTSAAPSGWRGIPRQLSAIACAQCEPEGAAGAKQALMHKPIVPTCAATVRSEHEIVQHLVQHLPQTEVVNGIWFSYNSTTGCWDDNQKDDYKRIVLHTIHPSHRRVSFAHRVLDHLEDQWRVKATFFSAIRRDGDRLDSVLVNTKNCVLRVTPTQIERLPHDHDHRFTRCLAVDYDPAAHHDLYLSTLSRILPDTEDRQLHQLIVANTLIPDARFEVSAVYYGEAGTGKDTIYAPIAAIYDKAERGLLTNLSIAQICDPRSYVLPTLRFACLNLCTELNSIHVEDSSIFKTIVSGMSTPAREIYKSPFDLRTHCKLISLSNNLPRFRDGTAAEIRRMRFIRCALKPSAAEMDVTLKERLRPAHPGTLNWMLEGLQKLLSMGRAPMPLGGPISLEVHRRFEHSNDPVGNFTALHTCFDPTAMCPKDDLLKAFLAYAEEHDVPEQVSKLFFKRLYERYPALKKARPGSDGLRIQAVQGISLLPSGIELKNSLDLTVTVG